MVPKIWSVIDRIFFVVLNHFLPFYPTNNPKYKNFEKWQKTTTKKCLEISFYTSVPKIIIICYTVLEIWRMTDVIFIFHFGLFLAHLTTKSQKKSKFLKNWKKCLEISSFYTCVPKIMIRWCRCPEIWCTTDGRTDRWK